MFPYFHQEGATLHQSFGRQKRFCIQFQKCQVWRKNSKTESDNSKSVREELRAM